MRLKPILLCMFVLSFANLAATAQGWPQRPAWPQASLPGMLNPGQAPQLALRPPSKPVPETFFGMHMHNVGASRPGKGPEPWPTVPFGSWRLWDSHVAWPSLEPKKGEWHFELLDKDVALAKQHNVDILLTLATTPTWASARPTEKGAYNPGSAAEPKSLDDWHDYVSRVAARYKGSILNYEVWNEPDDRMSYTGHTQELVTLTCEASKILKEASPDNKIISPPATGGQKGIAWLEDFLSKGGGKCVDVIGFHFYADTPEDMVPLIRGVRETMARNGVGDKPLWNTETGWPIVNHQNYANPAGAKTLNEDVASAYLARACLLQWAAGVSRFFYYAWDNKASGLTEPDGETTKPVAAAYRKIYDWMNGSVMNSCVKDKDGTWVAELTHGNGPMWVAWNPQGKSRWIPPAGAGVHSALDITGRAAGVSPDRTVVVDSTPKLIQAGR